MRGIATAIAQRALQTKKNLFEHLRMFQLLRVPNPGIYAIVFEQQYDDPFALGCLTLKWFEKIVTAICRPGGMKGGV